MDIDSAPASRNSPFINYFDVSTNFAWQEPRPEQIRARRADMLDGSLLFDVLLSSGGVEAPYVVYPPEDPQSLQALLDAIDSSAYDTLKKDCLVYFLLKWHQDGRERTFQQQRCIPPQFAALSDAYWHLDTGVNVPLAIAILSDARLNKEYASKILHIISMSADAPPLIRRYVQTAKPLLVEPFDIECYTLALADSSLMSAWQFTRTFNETDTMRARLFKKMVEWTVDPSPRPLPLSQLLALPLSPYEEDVLNDFVQNSPPTLKFSAVATLQDLICVRLIQGGRYNEAIKLDHKFTSVTLPKNLQLTKARSKMVRDIYAALPYIERSMINLELDPNTIQKIPLTPIQPSPIRKQVPPEPEAGDTSLSQSWESVCVPEVVNNQPTSTPLRNVQVPSTTPNLATSSSLQASTSTPTTAPILPLNLNGISGSGTTGPRKSLPLSSGLGLGSKPRTFLSGVGSRMVLSASGPFITSPASGMKSSLLGMSSVTPQSPGHIFIPASQQQNAFYKPPLQKTNGMKRTFEEDMTRSPERVITTGHDRDTDRDAEGEQNITGEHAQDQDHSMEDETSFEVTPKSPGRRLDRISAVTEGPEDKNEDSVLQYSVFRGASEESQLSISRPPPKRKSAGSRKKGPVPPGSFAPDDGDAMDEEHEEPEPVEKKRKTTRVRKSGKGIEQEVEAASARPPAKKARQGKASGLSRSIPGGFNDENEQDTAEDEEEDQVAPLRAPSPPRSRAGRKLRASISGESALDDGDGVQMRRRSSRLTNHGTGSMHESSPEPAPKPRKTARTTKKKKN